jgi:hypothetical protein
MTRQGRPPSARAASARVVQIKLRLYPGEDEDLIAFFEAILPRLRAAMVKRALRSGMADVERAQEQEEEGLWDALDAFVS